MGKHAKGKVFIVGAGPGDPDLITVKALRCIEQADVILYDRLVNKQLLAHASSQATLVYCGKAPGAHTMTQSSINETMISYASQGNIVVRLKGGDPLVFGRGAEEALELAFNDIPYEIVPGVTSAIGVAASEGIPVTHRKYAASFACVTGSRCHGDQQPVRWDLLAQCVDTLAIYMGVSELPAICEELLKHGKPRSTPVALIENGTTSQQRTTIGTLADIPFLASSLKVSNPAIIIIGEVVHVREQLIQAKKKAIKLIG